MRYIFKLFCVVFFGSFIISCANIVPPSGGAKDIIAPKVLNTNPRPNQLNFAEKDISIKFDEFVDLDNPNKTIIFSPPLKSKIHSQLLGKQLLLKFSEPLDSNTTYKVILNKTIKDYNEGNVLPNFSLKFSTGMSIDSSNVKILTNNDISPVHSNEEYIVLVRNKNDFIGNNFRYMSNVTNGESYLDNMDKNNYYLYAFIDSNMNHKYDNNEEVAFYGKKVSNKDTLLKLNFFKNNPDSLTCSIKEVGTNLFEISSNSSIETIKILNDRFKVVKKEDKTVLLSNTYLDTSCSVLINNKLLKYFSTKKSKNIPIDIFSKVDRMFLSKVSPDSIQIPFNIIINKLDMNRIVIKKDTNIVKNMIYKFMDNNLYFYNLDTGSTYTFRFDTMAIFALNQYNSTIIKHIATTYGKMDCKDSITIELTDTFSANTKFFVKNDSEEKQIFLHNNSYYIGKYCYNQLIIKVLEDSNNNNRWDTGNLYKEIQPERIETIKVPLVAGQTVYKIKLIQK